MYLLQRNSFNAIKQSILMFSASCVDTVNTFATTVMVSEIANSRYLSKCSHCSVPSAHAPVALSEPNDCDSTQMDEHDARPAADWIYYRCDNIVNINILCPNTNLRMRYW